MARPTKARRICMEAAYDNFCPEGVPAGEKVIMTMDEYETIRLVDLEKRTHEQCAKQMGIARTTVTEIYESARYKMADSIVNGKTLEISGGNYRLCDGTALFCYNKICRRTSTSVGKDDIQRKETDQMRIAVTYENGEIFQHFGHTEQFKLYDIENNQVVKYQIVNTNGQGHGALAGFLTEADADVLICGGIGGGAQAALAEAGVELCSGAQGDVDAAVDAYLKGELVSTGVNCDHHHHEDGHSCGSHEDGHSCGGHEDGHSCGGCGGGCGSQPSITGPNVGKTCRTHYRGTFNDGTQFDSSYDRGEPLEFICGAGQMIKGFDAAVANMEVGQVIDVHLMPEEAYGMPNPDAIFTLEIEQLPGAEDLTVGQQVYLSNQYGQPFPVKVNAKDEKTITFDANHEMAGKELNFRIELVEVK